MTNNKMYINLDAVARATFREFENSITITFIGGEHITLSASKDGVNPRKIWEALSAR